MMMKNLILSFKKFYDEIKKKRILTELLSLLVIILLIGFTVYFVYLFSLVINNFKIKYGYYFVVYILLVLIFNYLAKLLSKSRVIKYVNKIVAFPIACLYILGGFALPILTFYIRLVVFIVLVSSPALIVWLALYLFKISLPKDVQIYTYFTLTSIIIYTFYKIFLKWSLRIYALKETEEVAIMPLLEMLINKDSIKFVIYSLYFIFLAVYSVNQIDTKFATLPNLDLKTIMMSFTTFLAFEKITSNFTKVKYLPSQILTHLLKSVIANLDSSGKVKNEK